MNKIYSIIFKYSFIRQLILILKMLSIWYLFHFFSFSNIFEDNTKVYWCYGSFSFDDNIEYLLISICSASIPTSIFLILFLYLGFSKIKKL